MLTIMLVILGCDSQQDSEFNVEEVNELITGARVNALNATQISLSFESNILEEYSLVIVQDIINKVFINPAAYLIYSEQVNSPLEIDNIEQIKSNDYIINLIEAMPNDSYILKLFNLTKEVEQNQELVHPILVDEEFVFAEAPPPIEKDKTNFVAFTPMEKEFADGFILKLLDAELGSPSFYTIKISIPDSLIIEQNLDLNTIKSDMKYNALVKGIEPSVHPTTNIRKSAITGYGGLSEHNASTNVVDDFYDEVINNKNYKSLELLFFLNALPDMLTEYKVKVKVNKQNTDYYETDGFYFRMAFTKTVPDIFKNNNHSQLCIRYPETLEVKCIGTNQFYQTGYDLGARNAENFYELPFIAGTKNTHDLAGNNISTCVITDYEEINQYSNTKCWGVNYVGLLANGSMITGLPTTIYNESSDGSSFMYTTPANASQIIPASGIDRINSKAIFSGYNSICSVDFANKIYCWGDGMYIANSETSKAEEFVFNYLYDGKTYTIDNLENVYFGANEIYCFVSSSTADDATTLPTSLICDNKDSQSISPRYIVDNPTANIDQVSIGDSHVCVLGTSDGQHYANNLYCYGDNSQVQMGILYDENGSLINYSQELINVDIGGDIAIKMIAGNDFTCYINNNYQLRCSGYAENSGFLTSGDPVSSTSIEFANKNYMNFGSNIKVIDVFKGLTFICAKLQLDGYDDKYYGYSCWGDLHFNYTKYYNIPSGGIITSPYTFSLRSTTPMLRW